MRDNTEQPKPQEATNPTLSNLTPQQLNTRILEALDIDFGGSMGFVNDHTVKAIKSLLKDFLTEVIGEDEPDGTNEMPDYLYMQRNQLRTELKSKASTLLEEDL